MSNSGLSGVSGVSGLSIGGAIVLPPAVIPPVLSTATFGTVTGITDTKILDAIAWLETRLRLNYSWDAYKAIYPLVGGTADRHKWNLKDLRDDDAAYRVVWTNVTHSATGMTGAAGGWGDTKYTGPTNSLGMYVQGEASTSDYGMGHLNASNTGKRQMIHPRWPTNLTIFDPSPSSRMQFTSTGPIGYIAYYYEPSSDCFGIRNNVVAITRTPVPTEALMTTADIAPSMQLGAVGGFNTSRSTRTFSLFTICGMLTREQAIADGATFAEFQAKLGRHADPWTDGTNRWTTDNGEDWY